MQSLERSTRTFFTSYLGPSREFQTQECKPRPTLQCVTSLKASRSVSQDHRSWKCPPLIKSTLLLKAGAAVRPDHAEALEPLRVVQKWTEKKKNQRWLLRMAGMPWSNFLEQITKH